MLTDMGETRNRHVCCKHQHKVSQVLLVGKQRERLNGRHVHNDVNMISSLHISSFFLDIMDSSENNARQNRCNTSKAMVALSTMVRYRSANVCRQSETSTTSQSSDLSRQKNSDSKCPQLKLTAWNIIPL